MDGRRRVRAVESVTDVRAADRVGGLFTLWPLVARQWLREDRWPVARGGDRRTAWLPGDRHRVRRTCGATPRSALVPLILGAFAIAAAAGRAICGRRDDPRRTSALAWLCGAALSLLTIAIPMQVEKEWITIGWALEGAAMLVLWTRLDHPGLKYTAMALLLAATVRLVGNRGAHVPPARRVADRQAGSPTHYLVPGRRAGVRAHPGGAGGRAPARLRATVLPARRRPLLAGSRGPAALVVVFVWINPRDRRLVLAGRLAALPRRPHVGEKLVLSIAWALYAVVLLALGVRLRGAALGEPRPAAHHHRQDLPLRRRRAHRSVPRRRRCSGSRCH